MLNRVYAPFFLVALAGCGGNATAPATSPGEVPLSEPITAPKSLEITSTDFTDGGALANAFVFNGFGCFGENKVPALSWKGAPAGTKSFAIVVHDPDAPTGVGFFHWIAFDIPANVTSLATNAPLPAGASTGRSDFGTTSYGGPCPPPGTPHRYVFTVYALKEASLGMKEPPSGALLRFSLGQNTLAYGRITGTYSR
ncbi:MAG: YbhB/YbcL family Raf kinase inhibitor-like protein [Polyangiaceae bacterium]